MYWMVSQQLLKMSSAHQKVATALVVDSWASCLPILSPLLHRLLTTQPPSWLIPARPSMISRVGFPQSWMACHQQWLPVCNLRATLGDRSRMLSTQRQRFWTVSQMLPLVLQIKLDLCSMLLPILPPAFLLPPSLRSTRLSPSSPLTPTALGISQESSVA